MCADMSVYLTVFTIFLSTYYKYKNANMNTQINTYFT